MHAGAACIHILVASFDTTKLFGRRTVEYKNDVIKLCMEASYVNAGTMSDMLIKNNLKLEETIMTCINQQFKRAINSINDTGV
jgi:hypothetical protein